MGDTNRGQRQYDHRLRRLIQTTGDIDLAIRHGVPRSTIRGWLKQTPTDVVSIDALAKYFEAIQREVLSLRRRVNRLLALLHLVVMAIKVNDFSSDSVRIPDRASTPVLLRALERAPAHMPLRGVLKISACHARVITLGSKSRNAGSKISRVAPGVFPADHHNLWEFWARVLVAASGWKLIRLSVR